MIVSNPFARIKGIGEFYHAVLSGWPFPPKAAYSYFTRMRTHLLRIEAEDFEAVRTLVQRQRLFKKYEQEGLVVTPETLASTVAAEKSALKLVIFVRLSSFKFEY